jgi:hypothetical protein
MRGQQSRFFDRGSFETSALRLGLIEEMFGRFSLALPAPFGSAALRR